MMTFFKAIFVMATFVHIRNISAVTGPILTKLFGPNFFEIMIFVDQNVLGQNFFGPKFFLNTNFFKPQIFFPDPKVLDQKSYWFQKNFEPKFFRRTIFSDSNFFYWPNFILDTNFCLNVFSDPQFFFLIFFRPKIYKAFTSWTL